ncbi:uncharacterized protein TNCV_2835341 [Trichonephila clavipes]|uniref:Tc1-like transposase DDE domain-containing protein n=1 Tax=Trichonephila clavipes TaxID=2585209 RepID=A0A8X6RZE9_TRICX|nr:uncharacterized protein TNCV_2835341 [Trichonephila clavipes]
MKAVSILVPITAVCYQNEARGTSATKMYATGPTPGVMVWLEAFYDIKSSLLDILNILTGNVCASLDNARPHNVVLTQRALKSVDVLPWSARYPDLSSIDHVWGIIGRELQHHPQPVLTRRVLTQHV